MLETPSLAPDSKYIVQMQLRDSWLPTNNIFAATEMIWVGDSDIPAMDMFFDAACTLPSTSFTTAQTVYVRIQDRYGGAWNQYGGTLELVDFYWNMPVKRIPSSVAVDPEIVNPVSYIGKLNTTTYVFAINLTMANQDPWTPGNNSYMLRYDSFVAGTERYTLSGYERDMKPPSNAYWDVVIGAPFTSHTGSVGTDFFIEYYRNNNNWLYPDYLEFKNQKGEGFTSIEFVRLGERNDNDERMTSSPSSIQSSSTTTSTTASGPARLLTMSDAGPSPPSPWATSTSAAGWRSSSATTTVLGASTATTACGPISR